MSYKSVWDYGREAKVSGIHLFGEYPSKILPYAAHEVIERFSKEGDIIFDPFCGSGTFAIEAKALNRNSINYDINPNAVKLTLDKLREMEKQTHLSSLFINCPACGFNLKKEISTIPTNHIVEQRDSRKTNLENEFVDSIITDIPYASMIKYSNHPDDLSTIDDYENFLNEITFSFKEMWRVLKKGKYCVIFVADYRVGASRKILPVHSDVIKIMQSMGFDLFDLFIWRYYRSGLFRPFGKRPFQAMNVHSYILVFYKPNGDEILKMNKNVKYRKKLIDKIKKNGFK